jgi:hypothetical protein
MRKKGVFLPEVLLSVIVIGMVVGSLLVFFNEMNNKEGDEAVLATMISDINQELYYYGAIGGGTTGINEYTDLISHRDANSKIMFSEMNNMAQDLRDKLGGSVPSYTLKMGLKISFNPNILSCTRLLRFDLGFLEISQDGISYRSLEDDFKSVLSGKIYCDSLGAEAKGYEYFYLKN